MRLSLLTLLPRAPGLWFRAHRCPGQPASVESESPLWIAAEKQELSVSPRQIDTFTRELEQQPPHHFSGIVWFRLPLDNDTRARSLSTLAAVIRHQPLTSAGSGWRFPIRPTPAQSPRSTNWRLKHRQY